MLKLKSYAKINLFLDIENKRHDGYHSIKTVMQSISIFDEITLTESSDNFIKIECNDISIPTDNSNTCYKAVHLIKEKFNISSGVNIYINKTIPSEAGLAGGSGNSAAVIRGLNCMWKLNMSEEEMIQIGVKIGADVPFCLMGGTYLCTGIGEKLMKLEDFRWDNILIVKPEFNMSTKMVYENLLPQHYNSYSKNKIAEYINEHNNLDAALSIDNVFETVVGKFHSEIKLIKTSLTDLGAISSLMTGSGSAVFGLFNSKTAMYDAFNVLKNTYPHIYTSHTVYNGVEFFVDSQHQN